MDKSKIFNKKIKEFHKQKVKILIQKLSVNKKSSLYKNKKLKK